MNDDRPGEGVSAAAASGAARGGASLRADAAFSVGMGILVVFADTAEPPASPPPPLRPLLGLATGAASTRGLLASSFSRRALASAAAAALAAKGLTGAFFATGAGADTTPLSRLAFAAAAFAAYGLAGAVDVVAAAADGADGVDCG